MRPFRGSESTERWSTTAPTLASCVLSSSPDGLHRHRLRVVAEAQLKIDRCLLAHFEIYLLRRLLESGLVDRQRVRARLQAGNLVEPGRVGSDFAFRACSIGGKVNCAPGIGRCCGSRIDPRTTA